MAVFAAPPFVQSPLVRAVSREGPWNTPACLHLMDRGCPGDAPFIPFGSLYSSVSEL